MTFVELTRLIAQGAIYNDRLEVVSNGGLHFGITVDDLVRPHRSQPWNPDIAQAFYRRGIIETWGRGTLKIRELCAEANLPKPEFRADMHSFTACFRPRRGPEEQVTSTVTPQLAGQDKALETKGKNVSDDEEIAQVTAQVVEKGTVELCTVQRRHGPAGRGGGEAPRIACPHWPAMIANKSSE